VNALAAVAVSVVAGLVTVRPGDYGYWSHWVKQVFVLASAGMVLIYALAGLVGFEILHAVEPARASTGAALIEGLAGHAVIRARIDIGGIGEEPTGESLLGVVRRWIVDWLNGSARQAIRIRLDHLTDDALVGLAYNIFWEDSYGEDPAQRAAAAEQLPQLDNARRRLKQTGAVDARARLRGFSLAEIQRHHLILVGAT
jgi:hypothetical protein